MAVAVAVALEGARTVAVAGTRAQSQEAASEGGAGAVGPSSTLHPHSDVGT